VAICLLALVDRRGWLLYEGHDLQRYDGQSFQVLRVVDGDTLVLDVADGDEPLTRVRLWGIDTPERAREQTGRPAEPLAEEARDFTQRWCGAGEVVLRLEPARTRGHYGRLLAHVERPDGVLLGADLLAAGLARMDDLSLHQHEQTYRLIEQQAQYDRAGIWAEPAR
jgi:endonuclease YncB( thermonuclease family)